MAAAPTTAKVPGGSPRARAAKLSRRRLRVCRKLSSAGPSRSARALPIRPPASARMRSIFARPPPRAAAPARGSSARSSAARGRRPKRTRAHRERIVGRSALGLAVTSTKRSPGRGSSRVLRSAFAALSPMRSAGSMMTTRGGPCERPTARSARTTRICETVICDRISPRLDAAPNLSSRSSGRLSDTTRTPRWRLWFSTVLAGSADSMMARHARQAPQGSPPRSGARGQWSARASVKATRRFPTPSGPSKRSAGWSRPASSAARSRASGSS